MSNKRFSQLSGNNFRHATIRNATPTKYAKSTNIRNAAAATQLMTDQGS